MSRKRRNSLFTICAYAILLISCICVLFPVYWVFMTSIKGGTLVYEMPPRWFFTPTFDNYRALVKDYYFSGLFINSLIVAGITTIICIIFGSFAAYSFARFNTGGNGLRGWVLNNRTMPAVAMVLPIFMLANTFGLINKHLSLIIAYLTFSLPFAIWMMITFFESVPREIEEAAIVDGATKLQSFFLVTVPLTTPGIASTGILTFLFAWNEFLFAMLLSGTKTRTLPIGVANFMTQRGIEYGALSAAIIVMIVPVLILTFSIRNYLVKGLSGGAIK